MNAFTRSEIAALEAWADPAAAFRREVRAGAEHFRGLTGRPAAAGSAPATEATARQWAEAMRDAGTLGDNAAGRSLAARFNFSMEHTR